MRYENATCRYDANDVIERVLILMGLPPPPAGRARECAEMILRSPIVVLLPGSDEHRERIALLLKIIDASIVTPTSAQVQDPTQLGESLFVVGLKTRTGVEIHAGVGAVFYRAASDTLFSEVAPITGTGLSMRQDYLHSVIEAARDVLESTFS